jgi:hypothetical protein
MAPAITTPDSARARGSLSIDLDDEWAYRRSLGDPAWEQRPTFLSILPERMDAILGEHHCTAFAVGYDARTDHGGQLLRDLAARGHEIASHSDDHDLRLHRRAPAQIDADLAAAAAAIAAATGTPPAGFRAPGYGSSRALRAALARAGYAYDASPFPSPLGAPARFFYGRHQRPKANSLLAPLDAIGDIARGLRPRRRQTAGGELLQVPVTVFPFLRLPIHASNLLILAGRSETFAGRYLDRAFALCERRGIGPSLVVHPTDLIGPDDAPAMAAFPGMAIDTDHKLGLVRGWLDGAAARFDLGTVAEHAATAS